MDDYFKKVALVKTVLKEISQSNDYIRSLKSEMELCCSLEKEKKISETLQISLESTYLLITKTRKALQMLAQENSALRVKEISILPIHSGALNPPDRKPDRFDERSGLLSSLVPACEDNRINITLGARYGSCDGVEPAVEQQFTKNGWLATCSTTDASSNDSHDPDRNFQTGLSESGLPIPDLEGGPVVESPSASLFGVGRAGRGDTANDETTFPLELESHDAGATESVGVVTSDTLIDEAEYTFIHSAIGNNNQVQANERERTEPPLETSSVLKNKKIPSHPMAPALVVTDSPYILSAMVNATTPGSAQSDHWTSGAEYRIRMNVYSGVIIWFKEVVHEFQKVQNDYSQAAQAKCLRQIQLVYPQAKLSDVADLMHCGTPSLAVQEALRASLTKDYEKFSTSWRKMQSTYHDVKKLEHCVLHIHKMYIELNAMLDDQQSHIDHIHYEVSQTKEETTRAKDNLMVADKYHMASGKSGLCAAILLLIASSAFFSRTFHWVGPLF